jgi:hypothetical protein
MAQMTPTNTPVAPNLSAAFTAAIASAGAAAAAAAGMVVVDNGDGSLSITPVNPSSVADNGDGTITITA